MNNDLITLKNWLNMNKLSLNALKTKCMFIATRQKVATLPEHPNVTIDGNQIERVNTYKCLGLEFDEGLTWDVHIAKVISKATQVIGRLTED